ncbi:hypothetical protein DP83_03530 [Vibrio metoecus]|uniref:Uncharacterized protein n=1 Tax=Vibrio metoecus TaxID=1481663 RepID=A0ABR4S111_VIBMT|nr:hypothetical protein DP83_03530 [Vibrio metoecus]
MGLLLHWLLITLFTIAKGVPLFTEDQKKSIIPLKNNSLRFFVMFKLKKPPVQIKNYSVDFFR